MMRRMAMLAETELCVPKIVYHSYFDRDPLFNVSIDPEAVAKLCSILGMKNEDIAKKTIVVSPQILPDSTVGATYCTQTQTVTLYPGIRWDRYQELVFKAQLAATGRGVRKQVVFIPPNEVVNKEIEKGITEGQSKAKIAKQVRKELTLVLGENRAKNVTEAIGDNDFYAVNCFLKKTIDGQLKEDLGHELKHAKDNPPTFRTKGFTWFLPKFGSFLTTAFIIMQTRSLELGDKDVYGSLISAGFAYGVFETMNRSAAICAYWLDPYEVHARACGEKVRKDSQWASLINTKGQWF